VFSVLPAIRVVFDSNNDLHLQLQKRALIWRKFIKITFNRKLEVKGIHK
jgi:hypothetical protein